MRTFLVLSLLCCSFLFTANNGYEIHRHEGDEEFEKYLRETIENFRNQMPTGIPEINMPVLDPLKLQDMDIQVNENIATLSLKLKQIFIRNLSNFYLNNIKANLEELFVHLNLTIPLLAVDGFYGLDGRLFRIFPLDGCGHMSINATGIQLTGTGELLLTADAVRMSVLKLDLYWEKMTADLEHFMGGGSFSEVLQRLIPGVGRDVFFNYKPLILSPLENALKRKVNEMLDKQIVKDILKEIWPKGVRK